MTTPHQVGQREVKPFCSNPGCQCGELRGVACEEYINTGMSAQDRCYRCGWWKEDHR